MTEEIHEIERLIKQSGELGDSLIRLARKLQGQNHYPTQHNEARPENLAALHKQLTYLRSYIDVVTREISPERYFNRDEANSPVAAANGTTDRQEAVLKSTNHTEVPADKEAYNVVRVGERVWQVMGRKLSPVEMAAAAEEVQSLGGSFLICKNGSYINVSRVNEARRELYSHLAARDDGETAVLEARFAGLWCVQYLGSLGVLYEKSVFDSFPELCGRNEQWNESFLQGFRSNLSNSYDEEEERYPGGQDAQEARMRREQVCAQLAETLSQGLRRNAITAQQEATINALRLLIADKTIAPQQAAEHLVKLLANDLPVSRRIEIRETAKAAFEAGGDAFEKIKPFLKEAAHPHEEQQIGKTVAFTG
jgi:hypothetical protein